MQQSTVNLSNSQLNDFKNAYKQYCISLRIIFFWAHNADQDFTNGAFDHKNFVKFSTPRSSFSPVIFTINSLRNFSILLFSPLQSLSYLYLSLSHTHTNKHNQLRDKVQHSRFIIAVHTAQSKIIEQIAPLSIKVIWYVCLHHKALYKVLNRKFKILGDVSIFTDHGLD